MIKLTCLLLSLDFILGRETKFRVEVKSIKIYNESQHYMWHWYPETIILMNLWLRARQLILIMEN